LQPGLTAVDSPSRTTAERHLMSQRLIDDVGPAPGRGSFTEISFGLTYRDSWRPVAAGEWLASVGGR